MIGVAGVNFGAGALPNGTIGPTRLVFGSFATARAATMAGPQYFYDQTTANLWQDRDGTASSGAMTLVLVFDNHPLIDASDLVVGDYFFS